MPHIGTAEHQEPYDKCRHGGETDNDYRARHWYLLSWCGEFRRTCLGRWVSFRKSASMEKKNAVICVFCGSSFGNNPQYAAAAKTLGRLIAERGFSLVFGGGTPGLMGVTARAARDGGAVVTGVLPDFLRWVERPAEWEQSLIITPDLQLRKTRMLAMADAFVVLPGGAGTMDEFFEVITSAQLRVLAKPIALVNTKGYFEPLQRLLQQLVHEGFAKPAMFDLYAVVGTPEAAIDLIAEKLGQLTP
jgi:uncharacterized protein (TIGR00730 family)